MQSFNSKSCVLSTLLCLWAPPQWTGSSVGAWAGGCCLQALGLQSCCCCPWVRGVEWSFPFSILQGNIETILTWSFPKVIWITVFCYFLEVNLLLSFLKLSFISPCFLILALCLFSVQSKVCYWDYISKSRKWRKLWSCWLLVIAATSQLQNVDSISWSIFRTRELPYWSR